MEGFDFTMKDGVNGAYQIRISVRELVEFVLNSGDIDNRRTAGAKKEAMQEGSRLHRKIQKQMGAGYQAEVTMRHVVQEECFCILVEGRADGVLSEPGGFVIDEIKCVYMDISRLEEPVKVLATLISALVAVGVVKLIGGVTILYGRRKFALYIIIGLLEKALFTYFYFGDSYMFYNLSMTIGYLVPGILGGQIEKQGCGKTLCALAVVVLLIKTVQLILT